MCVAFPTSDAVMETVGEDEIYDMQFGNYFAAWVRLLREERLQLAHDDVLRHVSCRLHRMKG